MDHVCPLLRLAGERHIAIDGVDAGHRCHASDPPLELDRLTQSRLCLTDAHARCERLIAHEARNAIAATGRLAAGDGFVSTRLLLAPQPAWRGIAGRARRPRSMAVVGAGLVVGVAAIGVAGLAMSGALADAGASPTQTAAAAATATPRPTATRPPTPSPTPVPTATAVPTAVATPTPAPTPLVTAAPTPVPQQTYTVVAGDTLALIAQRFGTTVAALQAANDIDDPNAISVGQVLVIP